MQHRPVNSTPANANARLSTARDATRGAVPIAFFLGLLSDSFVPTAGFDVPAALLG